MPWRRPVPRTCVLAYFYDDGLVFQPLIGWMITSEWRVLPVTAGGVLGDGYDDGEPWVAKAADGSFVDGHGLSYFANEEDEVTKDLEARKNGESVIVRSATVIPLRPKGPEE
jgi:hypothetical protein